MCNNPVLPKPAQTTLHSAFLVQAIAPQGLAPAARLVVEELALDKAQHQAGLASPHVAQQDQLGLLDAANPGPLARHVADEGCPDAAGQLGGECSPQAGQKVPSSGACWRSAATLALEPMDGMSKEPWLKALPQAWLIHGCISFWSMAVTLSKLS